MKNFPAGFLSIGDLLSVFTGFASQNQRVEHL